MTQELNRVDFQQLYLLTDRMNVLDLTVDQLKQAVALKAQIDKLNKQLSSILGGSAKPAAAPARTTTMSAAVKKKIAATQKARWAKIQGSKPVSYTHLTLPTILRV